MCSSRALRVVFATTCLVSATASPSFALPSELPPELGYNQSQQETPRSIAMGSAVRALSHSVEGLYLNPANMATTRVYHLAGAAQIWPQARRQTYGGAAVDSVVNRQRIAGGVAANWTKQDSDGLDRGSVDFRFGLAMPVSDQFFVGAAARYLTLTQNGYERGSGLRPSAASSGLPDENIVADITFDAGLTLKITPEFALSVVGQNLTDTGHGFLPLMLGGGVGYGTQQFTIEFDAVSDFTTFSESNVSTMVGGEVLVAEAFPLRAGYKYDQAFDSHSVSGGVGYVSREFSLEAGLRAPVQGPKALTIVFGFKYHVDAGGASQTPM